jgi:hypothetical protein
MVNHIQRETLLSIGLGDQCTAAATIKAMSFIIDTVVGGSGFAKGGPALTAI